MKIPSIFILVFLKTVTCQESSLEILSVKVDGLLMENALITTSATCGLDGPEVYCRLVDERSLQTQFNQENVLCDICDDRNKTKRHPIEYAKSNDANLWWQSPSMAQGLRYQYVNVTIDLKQVYQIVYILLKMGDSPRPGNWILERSLDGEIYIPWIFFAETPYYCYHKFKRQYPDLRLTTNAQPNSLEDDETFCTTYYSQPESLNSGEIIISLIHGRKSLMNDENPTAKSIPQKLINFLSARFIRFRFLKHLTLAADMMTHKGYLEKSIYNRYFYSLRNIEIGGKCICNNHADKCDKVVVDGISVAKCICRHNTCGSNCEICCPLFNQNPWKPIVPCEECNCNRKSNECVYNQTVATLQMSINKMGRMEGGGVCLNCQENTEGINCEKCKKRFYRPWNVLATEQYPCKPCKCDGIGSLGDCVSNGQEVGNQKPGDCICKIGYIGENCQSCAIGYEKYPNGECLPCPCSIDGSVTSSLYRCKPPCNCKINVEPNDDCKICKNGYFNLDPKNPEGCQPCYCFGITNQCTSLNAKSLQIHDLSNWKISTINDIKVANPRMTAQHYPISENSYLDNFFNNPSVYYWMAPQPFLGNLLTSYGSILRYVVKIELSSPIESSQIDSPDVIMKCGNVRLFYSVSGEERRLQRKVLIYLKPTYWEIGQLIPQREATRDEYLSCLVNVESLMIKAKYYSNQNTISLLNITLSRGVPEKAFNEMPFIEKCNCNPGFSGLSCESCEVNYRRVNNTFFQGQCEPCLCYNHSDTCDPFTGRCTNCLHNTNGPHCDECAVGYYGDSKLRNENSCNKCACPTLDNQMTDQCSTISSEIYICHDCKNNTSGPHCDRCAEGFHGNPRKKINCKRCECNNNEESCSEISGECKCSFNTMGEKCELCKYGFYGNALDRSCKKCECDSAGSKNQNCDKTSGQCICLPNFVNRKCDLCAPGFYLKEGKCSSCVCNIRGRIPSEIFCNSSSGKCYCLNGFSGEQCDQCSPGYYGHPNCRKCQCSSHALSMECDAENGHCKCGSFVTNTNCDKCQDSHYWANRTHCSPCNCGQGSINGGCDTDSGNCLCANNVIMRDCSKCQIGYYGLSPLGCKECPNCYNGQMCNNEGICVCPPNTAGKLCDKCADDSWNYNKTFGCKKCDCFPDGSFFGKCDRETGECSCQKSYKGLRCTECNDGFYGFPNCKLCDCTTTGTLADKLFMCDPISGKCQCKPNIMGQKCDMCKMGTFPSNDGYEGGCFSCFCLGITDNCRQLMNHRIIENQRYEYQIFDGKNSLELNEDLSTIKLNSSHSKKFSWPFSLFRPVFVEVLPFFKSNDLSLFYRSVIMDVSISCLDSKCGRENSIQQEVILESFNGLLELRYLVNHSFANSEDIHIELSEHPNIGQWVISKYKNDRLDKWILMNNSSMIDINLTRDIFMMALLNVTSLRVQLYSGKINPKIVNLKLVTYDAIETLEEVGKLITSVEKCNCNSVTTGNHCQDPQKGFFKQSFTLPDIQINVDSRSGHRIIVNVKKCDCNGHSTLCNGNTGVCRNCSNNTTGNKCDLCIDGFYGEPQNNGRCYSCECPTAQYNFAKSCKKSPYSINYQCQCMKGHQGSLCEKCEMGFYGNPYKGIPCKACECNSEGSVNSTCNENGFCQCFPGVLGMKCDQCADDYVVENKKCQSCYTGCTKQLFDRIDKFNNSLKNFKWKTFPSNIDRDIQEMNFRIQNFSAYSIPLNKFYKIWDEINNVSIQFQKTKDKAKQEYNEAVKLKNMYTKDLSRLISIFRDINETISGDKFVGSSDNMINNDTIILQIIENMFTEMPNATEAELFLAQVIKHVDDLNRIIKTTESLMQLEQLSNLTILKRKTLVAKDINKDNQKYLRTLENNNEEYKLKIAALENEIKSSQKLIIIIIGKKKQLQEKIEKLEIVAQNLQNRRESITTIIKLIEELLANFTLYMSSPSKLFIPDLMKKHIEKQLEKSSNIIKNLTKESNFLHSAEQAKEAYSNISRDITEVDMAINTTKQQLDNSKSQLNLDIMTKVLIESYSNKSDLERKKNDINIKVEDLKNQHVKLTMNQKKLKSNNDQMNSKVPPEYGDIDSLRRKLSIIQTEQISLQNDLIIPINNSLSTFQIPNLTSALNTENIERYVQNVTRHYIELVSDTVDINTKIKKMRDNIKMLKERLSKARVAAELIHGAAARSTDPIRHVEKCVRHYVTYYLPKSIAFSLEFYIKPQFPNQQSLVLFGYDDSQPIPQAFAFTIERNNEYIFWYDYGNTMETLKLTKQLTKDNYAGVMIVWKLGKWEMHIKSITDSKDGKGETYSTDHNNILNSIRIGPQTNVFVGGFPSEKLLGKLKLEGKLVSHLKENYGSNFFKGCILGVKFMNSEFGLQDIEAIDEECKKTISPSHVLLQPFNCKFNWNSSIIFTEANLENVNKFKSSLQTRNQVVEKEFDVYFSGNGYAMINTSRIRSGNCRTKLDKVLSISAMTIPAMNPGTFQLIAVFANHIKDYGLVLGHQNGHYNLGFWNGNNEREIVNLHNASKTFMWNIYGSKIGNFTENIFGIDYICDPNSFLYLGDIPSVETKLIEKLKRLKVPNFGFTGNLRLLVNQKNIFQILATRFIHVIFVHSERINTEHFPSLFISSKVNRAIEIGRLFDYDVLNHGFAFTVDFMGQPITKTLDLLTIELTRGIISISLSKDLVFSLKINDKRIEKTLRKSYNPNLDWGPHSVVVSFVISSPTLLVSIVIDNEEVQMSQMNEVLGQQSSIRVGSDANSPHAYYFYHLFLGPRLVNFNDISVLPPGVFLRLRSIQLQPTPFENFRIAPFKPTARVSQILQLDAAAPPYEPYNSSKLYLPLLQHNVTKYALKSPKSEDYPVNSAWFDGISNNVVILDSINLHQYSLPTNNEISFKIRSASLRPEMLMSLNFESKKTLHIIIIDGHMVLFDFVEKWIAPFPIRLIDEEWHVINITTSKQNPERGIRIYQDDHLFDFPSGPFTFSFPFQIELGGYSGPTPKLQYKHREYQVQLFTGCLDSLKINKKVVSLLNGGNGNQIKRCPRVLEFLNTGGHIKDSYSQVYHSDDLIKLKIEKYSTTESRNTYVTKFKFKYTGFEQGSILIIGDGYKFCSISIKNREMQLNYRDFETKEFQADSIEMGKDKWYRVEFIVYHYNAVFSLCKMVVDDNEASLTLSDSQMFSPNFKEPNIYFGGYPNLSAEKVHQLTHTDQNFVGCISDLVFLANNVLVPCKFDKSTYIIGGRCSIDKNTFLRRRF